MDPFRYHPPTPITQPRYDAIRGAELVARTVIEALTGSGAPPTMETYQAIGDATRELHDLIGAVCPRSADTAAAQRCARIARMAANEAITVYSSPSRARDAEPILRQALDNLRAARWQACAAIALCPESDLPPWQPTP